MNQPDPSPVRSEAFAQGYQPSLTDRFGVWLSARQIRRWVPSFAGKRVGDVGCGFHATFVRTVLDEVASATLVDVALADDLQGHPKVHAVLGPLPDALAPLAAGSLDVVMAISVIEHLWDPLGGLEHLHRLLAPGGTCLVNVPSWRGKRYLELSAFKLGFSPREEMEDHKMYYDARDLWPLLVRAGFRPSAIRCFSHKLGLNTFAVCRKAGGRAEGS
ncbi:MAG TPA: methyltransferase domain-containing protein [Polyangia bacterium]|nr:methyltransferase domain-containing protein [Polyangia bacterium]